MITKGKAHVGSTVMIDDDGAGADCDGVFFPTSFDDMIFFSFF